MEYQILGDVHTHTLFSRHAYSTIQENVVAAAQAGLQILGSADHFSSMLFTNNDIRNFQFFLNQKAWPRIWHGVVLLRACEADILGIDGRLFGQDIFCSQNITGTPYEHGISLYDRATQDLDYVVASIHNKEFAQGASIVETTDMYLRVLEQKKVFILGHTGRSGVPYELDEVLLRAKELHKLIELNEHSLDLDPDGRHRVACRAIAVRCAELGVGVALSTDAHICTDIGHFPCLRAFLDEIHFPQELIINRNKETFLSALATSGIAPHLHLDD